MKNILNKGSKMDGTQGVLRTIPTGSTVVSRNLKKESVFIDKDGNFIDPRTKQIIKPVEREQVK